MRISDGEYKIMNIVWDAEGITASEIASRLSGPNGWSKTTTYTMINVCIEKGLLLRKNPKYHCYSLISRDEAAIQQAEALIDNNYGGSADLLVAALVGRKRLNKAQMQRLYDLVQSIEEDTPTEEKP